MIKIPRTPDHNRNEQRAGVNEPCQICGRGITKGKGVDVHVGNGGGMFLLPSEVDENDAGYLGIFKIGRNCLKNNPALNPYAVGGHVCKACITGKGRHTNKCEQEHRTNMATYKSGR